MNKQPITSDREHFAYLEARAKERFASDDIYGLAEKRGIEEHTLNNFKYRGGATTIERVADAMDASPLILGWLAWHTEIEGNFSVREVMIRERGDPERWVRTGAIEIPHAFPSLFADVDGLLMAHYNRALIPKARGRLYHAVNSYGRNRKENPTARGHRPSLETLSELAAFAAGDPAFADRRFDDKTLLTGLKIFFGYGGCDWRFIPLVSAANGTIVLPGLFSETRDGLLSAESKRPALVTISEFMAASTARPKRTSSNRVIAYIHEVAARLDPSFDPSHARKFFSGRGIGPGLLVGAGNLKVRRYREIDEIADKLGIRASALYWQRFGDEISENFKIEEIEITENRDGQAVGHRTKIGAIVVPRQFVSVTDEICELIDCARRELEHLSLTDSDIYQQLLNWSRRGRRCQPQNDTYRPMAEFLHNRYNLEDAISVDEITMALKIAFNYMRIRDYLPLLYKDDDHYAVAPEGIGPLWLRGRPLRATPARPERSSEQIGAARTIDYWLKNAFLIRLRFRTVPFFVRDDELGGAYRKIGAVVIPPFFQNFHRTMRDAIAQFAKQVPLRGLPSPTARFIKALLSQEHYRASEAALIDLATRLAKTITIQKASSQTKHSFEKRLFNPIIPRERRVERGGSRLNAGDWLTALRIYSDHYGMASNLPLFDEANDTFIVPEHLKGAFRPGRRSDGGTSHIIYSDFSSRRRLALLDILTGKGIRNKLSQIRGAFRSREILEGINFVMEHSPAGFNRSLAVGLFESLAETGDMDIKTHLASTVAHFLLISGRNKSGMLKGRATKVLEKIGFPGMTMERILSVFADRDSSWSGHEAIRRMTLAAAPPAVLEPKVQSPVLATETDLHIAPAIQTTPPPLPMQILPVLSR